MYIPTISPALLFAMGVVPKQLVSKPLPQNGPPGVVPAPGTSNVMILGFCAKIVAGNPTMTTSTPK
jgi:hypothetical protein